MGKKPTNHGPHKGSRQEMLPHRRAVTQLTQGDPYQRSLSNYAKETPGVEDAAPNILQMPMSGGL